ncbi:hypothetical protein D6745_01220 [Candidatus Woesearchaeota archaeon]|nr:MAG: hypothetical protein D6745_01220 [Candidatus Woesearchaeota archaeon]
MTNKIVLPQDKYETQCWNAEMARRGQIMRQLINPEERDLLVYYPAAGFDTIISRLIGAGTQVQVEKSHEQCKDFDPNPWTPNEWDGRRTEYYVQWLHIIDYWYDAFQLRPPEIHDGFDVYIDKHGIKISNNTSYKAYVYNLLREGGFLISEGTQNFFVGFEPELFGLEMILNKEDRPSCKGQPSHLSVWAKETGCFCLKTSSRLIWFWDRLEMTEEVQNFMLQEAGRISLQKLMRILQEKKLTCFYQI